MQHYSLYQIVEKNTANHVTVDYYDYTEAKDGMSAVDEHFLQAVVISKSGEVLLVVEKHLLMVDELEIV